MTRLSAIIASAMLSLLLPSTISARDYSNSYHGLPFNAEAPALPEIPGLTVSISDFGGKGDGITLNTDGFSKAIAHLVANGGGHLVVPEGVWVTGPIVMQSNIDLHISKNAIVLFSPDKNDFPILPPDEGTGSKMVQPLISASHQTNFSITGEGILDGNGERWRPVKRFKVSDAEWRTLNNKLTLVESTEDGSNVWYPVKNAGDKIQPKRPRLIRIIGCNNFLISGIVAQNSPNFHINVILSNNFIIDGVTVRCPWNAQNGDGIDLSSCNNALLFNCSVDAGDDSMCLKSGTGETGRNRGACSNIVIDRCTVFHGHGGFVIGSDTAGGMNNIAVKRCRFIDTDTGLRFKSGRDRGGLVTNVFVEDIVMCDIAEEAILFDCYYQEKVGDAADAPSAPVTADTPRFDGITIRNIVCRDAARALLVKGLPEMNVKNVLIEDCSFKTAAGMTINHATGITLKNIVLDTPAKPAVIRNGSSDITFINIRQ